MQTLDENPNIRANFGWIALAITPLFFASNIIFGRAAANIDPFTLAFLRWSISAMILFIIIYPQRSIARNLIHGHWKLLLVCGFLAMWVCGGLVYLALKHTTATNGTLIYTTPPLLIILIEAIIRGRKIRPREILGIFTATAGIIFIVSKGNISVLEDMQINRGDMMFIVAAISWAIYTIILKSKRFERYPVLILFATTALFGALTLAPVAIYEIAYHSNYPDTFVQWQLVIGIVFFASLIPFSLYQFGVQLHGPASASIFMYLLPPFGLSLAWIFLNEVPNKVALIGCALVLGGVILATLKFRQKN